MQDDSFSDGARTQWFYFSCLNIRKGTKVTFNVLNLTRAESSFAKGMQPFVFSQKHFEKVGMKWHRAGENVSYKENRRMNKANVRLMDVKFMHGPNC